MREERGRRARDEGAPPAPPKELPRIYSHAQATTTAAGDAEGADGVGGARRTALPPARKAESSPEEDLDEVNSDIDEEGKGFIDKLLSEHFVSEEAEARADAGAGERHVEPLNDNAKNFAEVGLDPFCGGVGPVGAEPTPVLGRGPHVDGHVAGRDQAAARGREQAVRE